MIHLAPSDSVPMRSNVGILFKCGNFVSSPDIKIFVRPTTSYTQLCNKTKQLFWLGRFAPLLSATTFSSKYLFPDLKNNFK